MELEKERRERQQLFNDISDNKIPHHVPSIVHIGFEGPMLYSGYDLKAVQWGDDPEPIINAYKNVIDKIPADLIQISPGRPIRALCVLGSKAFVMSNDGYIQHPEVHSMQEDEYDEFIEDPYKFMVEKAAPRIYTQLDSEKYGVARTNLTWVKAYEEFQAFNRKIGAVNSKINADYPFWSQYRGGSVAPMDHLADVLRSFSGISKDVRRRPEKVKEACEALLPILTKRLIPKEVDQYHYAGLPLHMAPFLNQKHFEELWWPTFEKQMKAAYEQGQQVSLFCESDFERFLDHLESLPGRNMYRFEYGDPKKAKQKVGDKHIIQGFYPAGMFMTSTKQQCIDKAKELIDILAPGGGYEFMLDKNIYTIDDQILDKVAAVVTYVRENTVY